MSITEPGDQLGVPVHPRQVQRISALREGFLHQHLYTVACILTVGRKDHASIVIEFLALLANEDRGKENNSSRSSME